MRIGYGVHTQHILRESKFLTIRPTQQNLVDDIQYLGSLVIRPCIDYEQQRNKVIELSNTIKIFLGRCIEAYPQYDIQRELHKFKYFITIENRSCSDFDFSIQTQFNYETRQKQFDTGKHL